MGHESKRFKKEVDNVLQQIGATDTTNLNVKTKLSLLKNHIDNCKENNIPCIIEQDDHNVDVKDISK